MEKMHEHSGVKGTGAAADDGEGHADGEEVGE
jgi:hypothetical protein